MYHLNPELFAGGYLGVPIFLCISGYLITDQLLRIHDNHENFSLKNFYIKRIKRLYPGLLLMLFTASTYIFLFQRNLLHNLHQIFVTNILNVFNWWEIANGQSYFERFANNQSPFTHLWTLSIEGQFYIIWPLLLLFLLRRNIKKGNLFIGLIAVSAMSAILMAILFNPSVDPSRVYYGTDTRIFSILLGSALAVVWPSMKLKTKISSHDRMILNIIGLVSMLVMLWLLLKMKATSPFMYRSGMFIFSIFTTVVVAIVAHPAAIWNKILTNPIFSYIGSRSYGLYLWQFPVMIFFESIFTNVASHPVLYSVIQIIIIMTLSELSFRFVEQPLAKFDYKKVLDYFKNLPKANVKTQAIFAVCFLLTTIGTAGIVEAVNTPAPKNVDNALVKEISDNTKDNKQANKKLIAKLKKDKSNENTSQNKKYEKLAESKPVNQQLEQYGLKQVDLQRAQDIKALAIGDSVMADGSNELKKIFPNMIVDAGISRQMDGSFDLLNSYVKQGVLPQVIVIGLGTNGAVSPQQVDEVMKIAGKKRNVYWINVHVPTRPWEKMVNNTLYGAKRKYKNLTVIDWNNYSKSHPDWFYGDKVHPNPTGSIYYSTFIAKAILKNEK
ncbi:acyltransferase [Companilactobacillus sp. RD055328]|nr:acyltransferase [Companilactobacillus sp. RD055328]